MADEQRSGGRAQLKRSMAVAAHQLLRSSTMPLHAIVEAEASETPERAGATPVRCDSTVSGEQQSSDSQADASPAMDTLRVPGGCKVAAQSFLAAAGRHSMRASDRGSRSVDAIPRARSMLRRSTFFADAANVSDGAQQFHCRSARVLHSSSSALTSQSGCADASALLALRQLAVDASISTSPIFADEHDDSDKKSQTRVLPMFSTPPRSAKPTAPLTPELPPDVEALRGLSPPQPAFDCEHSARQSPSITVTSTARCVAFESPTAFASERNRLRHPLSPASAAQLVNSAEKRNDAVHDFAYDDFSMSALLDDLTPVMAEGVVEHVDHLDTDYNERTRVDDNEHTRVDDNEHTRVDDNERTRVDDNDEDECEAIKDWNAEYQAYLEMADSTEKFRQLWRLTSDFEYAAQAYTKIIVSELPLSDGQKTIAPKSLGGVAGGAKYVVGNIVFKFAIDSLVPLPDDAGLAPLWMYGGGKGANHHGAIKAAGLELLHYEHLIAQRVQDICLPLLCLVDYHGHRVIAISMLPISRATLHYGSCDGARTVHRSLHPFVDRLERTFAGIGLKQHCIGAHQVQLTGPGDAEGHVGSDGRCYLLDLARLMPPELDLPALQANQRLVFCRLLRPEFVLRYPLPLCADSGTSWDTACPADARRNLDELKAAARVLHNEVIPVFARELLDEAEEQEDEDEDAPPSSEQGVMALFYRYGSNRLHCSGLNVRSIGRVRQHVLLAAPPRRRRVARALLSMAVARVLKNAINEEMRQLHRSLTVPSRHPFTDVVVDYLNLLLNAESEQHADFWRVHIKRLAELHFPQLLAADELAPTFNLRQALCPVVTAVVALHLLGVEVSADLKSEILSSAATASVHVLSSDVMQLSPKIKTLSTTAMWRTNTLWLQSCDPALSPFARRRLLSHLSGLLEASANRFPSSLTFAFQAAVVAALLATLPSRDVDDRFFYYQEPLLSQASRHLQRVAMLLSGVYRSSFGVSNDDRHAIITGYVRLLRICARYYVANDDDQPARACADAAAQHEHLLQASRVDSPDPHTAATNIGQGWMTHFHDALDRLESELGH